jgi:hypothetical protein
VYHKWQWKSGSPRASSPRMSADYVGSTSLMSISISTKKLDIMLYVSALHTLLIANMG